MGAYMVGNRRNQHTSLLLADVRCDKHAPVFGIVHQEMVWGMNGKTGIQVAPFGRYNHHQSTYCYFLSTTKPDN
jgi:hypothetical protein